MPGLLHRGSAPRGGGGVSAHACGIWSKQRDELSFDQLQKFWNDLPYLTRQELLRIDKQTLFEQTRKNLYCSRCNGLLLEGFSQIVMYGKSLHLEGAYLQPPYRTVVSKMVINIEHDDVQDPTVHPWGGLTATRDGILTVLDCFLRARSLKALQNVFDSARARERERELLYPDACGGGGRGWTSQGMAGYVRGHGSRETCALHTAKLSCDTLVDFWSALGDETRYSLLRMKEEDFIERLMYRFDSKRFCRDCRRNVVREFKELKELKRMHRETRCTNYFCVADTSFQCKVSLDTVEADWQNTFGDTDGAYHHFEWAVGTAEGKSDILEFEDVGMNGKALVNGLDLSNFSSCFITLRAKKPDGRCTELCVKAHALRGQQCVHRRLVIGDGYITITKGESIRGFFEHAEEAEEEDDDAIDQDENDYGGDGSRPQKHAKSPELAREFLLDAATVIFKEQVEKAFREGTAKQNAHSIFVCLSLKLLEERLHVACKEIITLEKQIKLLEEEENEKREEEERKERRRTKEREKKNRRKERLKGKERECGNILFESKLVQGDPPAFIKDSSSSRNEESPGILDGDSTSDQGDANTEASPISIIDETPKFSAEEMRKDLCHQSYEVEEEHDCREASGPSFISEQMTSSQQKLRYYKDDQPKWFEKCQNITGNEDEHQVHEPDTKSSGSLLSYSRCVNVLHRDKRGSSMKGNTRNCGLKYGEKFQGPAVRVRDRYDFHACGCHTHGENRLTDRAVQESGSASRNESNLDAPRTFYRSSRYNSGCLTDNGSYISKGKLFGGTTIPQVKQVWEPTGSSKKYMRRNSNPDLNLRSGSKTDSSSRVFDKDKNSCQELVGIDTVSHASDISEQLACAGMSSLNTSTVSVKHSFIASPGSSKDCRNGSTTSDPCVKDVSEDVGSCGIISNFPTSSSCEVGASASNSDNCSSCLSEGDVSSSLSGRSPDSSSTSDTEEASPQSDCTDSTCQRISFDMFHDDPSNAKEKSGRTLVSKITINNLPAASSSEGFSCPSELEHGKAGLRSDKSGFGYPVAQPQRIIPVHNPSVVPVYSSPAAFVYHHNGPASWAAAPADGSSPFHQPARYVYHGPVAYGLAAQTGLSEFFMQYNNLQSLGPAPVFNALHHPSCSIVSIVNNAESSKDPTVQNASTDAALSCTRRLEQDPCPHKNPIHDAVNNTEAHGSGSQSFSLFYFGGPVAPPASGFVKCPPEPPEAGKTLDAHTVLSCSRDEMKAEEYSLFSSGNSTMFSFF